jgi:uncharacterized DUF497 family protein
MTILEFSGFDWDEGNRQKCQKHGLGIDDVEHVLAHNETVIIPLDRYEEPRFLAIGRTAAGRFAFVVFTPREKNGERRQRPISARYMHQREVRKYGQEIAGLQKR